MAIEEVNANTGVFPSPPLVYLSREPEPAAIAATPPPPFVAAPVVPPEAPAAPAAPPEEAPPAPVENERGENIDTTA